MTARPAAPRPAAVPAARAAAAPAATRAAAPAASAPAASAANGVAVKALETRVLELTDSLAQAEKERDYYYTVLQKVEAFCMEKVRYTSNEYLLAEHHST